MRKWLASKLFWGILFIIGGLITLLQNLGYLPQGGIFWAILAGLGAVFFISFYIENRRNWWAFIPGISLIGLTVAILLDWLIPNLPDTITGFIFLGSIGISFLAIYLVDHSNWWAIIPGGTLLTIGILTALDPYINDAGSGGLFFLGMGLTFMLVAILPNPSGRMTWAWIPAGILAGMGVLMVAFAGKLIYYVAPAVLIVVGIVLVTRALRKTD